MGRDRGCFLFFAFLLETKLLTTWNGLSVAASQSASRSYSVNLTGEQRYGTEAPAKQAGVQYHHPLHRSIRPEPPTQPSQTFAPPFPPSIRHIHIHIHIHPGHKHNRGKLGLLLDRPALLRPAACCRRDVRLIWTSIRRRRLAAPFGRPPTGQKQGTFSSCLASCRIHPISNRALQPQSDSGDDSGGRDFTHRFLPPSCSLSLAPPPPLPPSPFSPLTYPVRRLLRCAPPCLFAACCCGDIGKRG
jgi:hypothetical protein